MFDSAPPPADQLSLLANRRHFLASSGLSVGAAALTQLLPSRAAAGGMSGTLQALHYAPRAKRVIYLFMSGGPSQMDLFDYKPQLNQMNGQQLPDSVRQGQRLTGMSANQATLPLAGAQFRFAQHGKSGTWVSELLPHTAKVVDDLCIIRSMHTEAINHDPAITFFQTGSQNAGRPSIGSWLSYGLGSMNDDLPTFCVLVTKGGTGQPIYSRLWGSGFLASTHQGVQFRSGKDPVLYLNNPAGVSPQARRNMLDRLNELHQLQYQHTEDPRVLERIEQYEMAFRMQTSAPEATDLSNESDSTFELYGPDAREPGTFAANCLLARRLAERNVRFIQLFHRGWDQHNNLPSEIRRQCRATDQGAAALVADLKQRGMLDDTLVVWGGEFGRTAYSQGALTASNYGRDHHPRCFTMWMAGGGVKPGMVYGETDDFSYNLTKDPVHVHDLHATMLHLLGIDHERLTYKHQGRRYRLTDVAGELVGDILS
ncbi:DUF1501 domain-containing protein [Aeoliella sp. ICT_H6.2]|uniref:DUF1501 domain-containing protein n=1 Tax=Aeoliella straminimaris TaxID=2954799 RepID=A0A9X2JHW9_9BACT|nr:DUF1501 domain-containing protein [Aeoliella straminimaris]MCO6046256.1 DUF1501 domain-containing protein [Aeoliella straminimaris]